MVPSKSSPRGTGNCSPPKCSRARACGNVPRSLSVREWVSVRECRPELVRVVGATRPRSATHGRYARPVAACSRGRRPMRKVVGPPELIRALRPATAGVARPRVAAKSPVPSVEAATISIEEIAICGATSSKACRPSIAGTLRPHEDRVVGVRVDPGRRHPETRRPRREPSGCPELGESDGESATSRRRYSRRASWSGRLALFRMVARVWHRVRRMSTSSDGTLARRARCASATRFVAETGEGRPARASVVQAERSMLARDARGRRPSPDGAHARPRPTRRPP